MWWLSPVLLLLLLLSCCVGLEGGLLVAVVAPRAMLMAELVLSLLVMPAPVPPVQLLGVIGTGCWRRGGQGCSRTLVCWAMTFLGEAVQG